jgi:hypothetical protein
VAYVVQSIAAASFIWSAFCRFWSCILVAVYQPPAFSQERARRTLFEMITCKGKNGDYHISIEDVPAFVELIRTLVHPSVRSHVAGFTVARVEANVRYLNE